MLAQPKDDMVPVCVINPSPAPVTLYHNTSVGTFSQLEDGALKPASCNQLATNNQRQPKPLVSEQFHLDTINLSSPQNKELVSLLDEFTDISPSGPADLGWTGVVQHCIDTGSAVTLVHCRVLQKAKIDFKLGMVSEPVVSANGQPLDIKGKCE